MPKAQGMPLNTIIIAAIVLVVLVILIVIFSSRINFFGEGIDECAPSMCLPTSRDCPKGTLPVPKNCNRDTPRLEYCCTEP